MLVNITLDLTLMLVKIYLRELDALSDTAINFLFYSSFREQAQTT